MDERLTYFLLVAIPTVCMFWFLYRIIITELTNRKTCRDLREHKPRAWPEGGSRVPPQKRPSSKVIRGFDSPDLWLDDTLIRIKALEQQIDQYDREIERRWKSKE